MKEINEPTWSTRYKEEKERQERERENNKDKKDACRVM